MGPAVRLLGCIRGRPGVVTTADSQRFYPTLLRPSVGSPCGLSSVLPRGSVPGAGGRSGAPVGPAAQWVYRTQGQRVTDRICLDRCGPSLGRMCVCVCVCARAGRSPLCRPGSNSPDLLPTGAYTAPSHGLALTRGPVKGLPDAAQNHSTWLGLFSLARHGRTIPAVHVLGFLRLRHFPRPLTRHLLQPRCHPVTPPEAPCAQRHSLCWETLLMAAGCWLPLQFYTVDCWAPTAFLEYLTSPVKVFSLFSIQYYFLFRMPIAFD